MKRNVAILWAIGFLQGLSFYMAMFSPYRQEMGVSLEQIALMESCHSLLGFLLVIPAGLAADRFGYKKVLLFANGIYFLSKVVFAIAGGFWGFLAERLLRAVAVSGISSINGAMLFVAGQDKKRGAFSGYVAANGAGLLLASVSLSTWLHNDVRLAAWCTAAAFLGAWILTCFLSDGMPKENSETKGMHQRAAELIGEFTKEKRILFFLAAAALFEQGAYYLSNVFSHLFYEAAGIGREYYGLLFALIRGTAVMSMAAPWLTGRLGLYYTISAALLAGAVSCVGIFFFRQPIPVVAALLLYKTATGIFAPLKMEVQNQVVSGENRAGMLAAFSLVTKGCYAVTDQVMHLSVSASDGQALLTVPCVGLLLCLLAFALFSWWLCRTGIGERNQCEKRHL